MRARDGVVREGKNEPIRIMCASATRGGNVWMVPLIIPDHPPIDPSITGGQNTLASRGGVGGILVR